MSKVFAFALLMLAGLVMAGTASAQGMGKAIDKSSSDQGTGSQVKAAVVSRSGDTVRLFAPDGNKVLCQGDSLPVFSPAGKMGAPSEGMMEGHPSGGMMEGHPSGGMMEGHPSEGMMGHDMRGQAPSGNMESMISSADTKDMDMIGVVRVDKLVGDNYAEGRLIVGDAGHGDIASKPSAQCLAPRG